ncbi:hypothetical protein LCGC14_1331460 [marine sediment metagenome]|uniref:Uncharacterized protein n=1 Tax=marine sediment metagenome TaxID=412755 RepID=A0A0F9MXB3_9ZZZZ
MPPQQQLFNNPYASSIMAGLGGMAGAMDPKMAPQIAQTQYQGAQSILARKRAERQEEREKQQLDLQKDRMVLTEKQFKIEQKRLTDKAKLDTDKAKLVIAEKQRTAEKDDAMAGLHAIISNNPKGLAEYLGKGAIADPDNTNLNIKTVEWIKMQEGGKDLVPYITPAFLKQVNEAYGESPSGKTVMIMDENFQYQVYARDSKGGLHLAKNNEVSATVNMAQGFFEGKEIKPLLNFQKQLPKYIKQYSEGRGKGDKVGISVLKDLEKQTNANVKKVYEEAERQAKTEKEKHFLRLNKENVASGKPLKTWAEFIKPRAPQPTGGLTENAVVERLQQLADETLQTGEDYTKKFSQLYSQFRTYVASGLKREQALDQVLQEATRGGIIQPGAEQSNLPKWVTQ